MSIMVNGLPGKMATKVAEYVLKSSLHLVPFSLTGAEISLETIAVGDVKIELIKPDKRNSRMYDVRCAYTKLIAVDYTHPRAVLDNAMFYCEKDVPFVMGTTGGDRSLLEETVKRSNIAAIIAPNMAKQIVLLQAMFESAAKNFPGAFAGYSLEITESHQQGKADTSGTAKAMVDYFNKLGVPFTKDQIVMIRDPAQQLELGIPEHALTGHGWHTYTLKSPDGSVLFKFTHNVNGRDVYAAGTIDALRFLKTKVEAGEKGKVYSMIDVLKGV